MRCSARARTWARADVLIGDADAGGVGKRDRGEIVFCGQRRSGRNGAAYGGQGCGRAADHASEAFAEHVEAGFQFGDAEIDAGEIEFGALAVQQAADTLLLALLRDVESVVHGLLLLLRRGQALLVLSSSM